MNLLTTILFLSSSWGGLALPKSMLQGRIGKAEAKNEIKQDYYRKWLTEDVKHIITPEEEAVFKALTTTDERERFIEQFWARRNPDPTSSTNAFKEEHYRRIAYVNSKFPCALPGWMTDRGRIYILHGPPSEIEAHPEGGTYYRPRYEGGGVTMTYPFEIWRYNYIEGVGADIELEFVDPTYTREYRLAVDPSEKDALYRLGDLGMTTSEAQGLSTKQDRRFLYERMKDSPFERYRTLAMMQRPATITHKELKEIVKVSLSYDSLPFKVRQDCFRLDSQHLLVPITLEVEKSDLTLRKEENLDVAKIAVYGIVRSIRDQTVAEFENDVSAAFARRQPQEALPGKIVYQKMVILNSSDKRCRLDLVVKDLNGGRVGLVRKPIVILSVSEGNPAASPLVLANSLRKLKEQPREDQQFVWGDVAILPSINKTFSSEDPLIVYFQLYNIVFDQVTSAPALSIKFTFLKDGQTVKEFLDEKGDSLHFYSAERVVLIKTLPISDLNPGKYKVSVEVRDRISNRCVNLADDFEVVRSQAAN